MRKVFKKIVFLEKRRDKEFLTIVSLLVLNMSDIKSILVRMKRNPNNVRFRELNKICEYYFGLPRIKKGNHRVYKMPWPGDPRVNIQNHKGMAKIYQVKQLIKAIEKLESENDSEE